MKQQILIGIALLALACNSSSQPGEIATGSDAAAVPPEAGNTQIISKHDSVVMNGENITEANKRIIPGESIGNARLNTDAEQIAAVFGKPDMSDAAMGKAWLTWYGKKDEHNNTTELNIYTAYKDTGMREKTVQQVRTTSSFFFTGKNIHVYSSLDEIEKAFPGIQKLNKIQVNSRNIVVYDDMQQGIAFEIAEAGGQEICTAILVHIKGRAVTDTYIPTPS